MFLDVTRLLGRRLKGRLPTGVDRVALAYVERFGLGRASGERIAAGSEGSRALIRLGRLELVLGPSSSQAVFSWLADPTAPRRPWAILAAALGSARPSGWLATDEVRGRWLVHAGHSGLENEHWGRALRAAGARPLIVVHDLIPITHPQHCRAGEAERHAQRMSHGLRWGHAIVANSASTLRCLGQWAAAQRLALPPATVAHLAPGGMPSRTTNARPAASCAEPYFVCIGTLEPRKNHLLLLRVWERVVERLGARDTPRLVLIGQRGWEIEQVERLLERAPLLQGVVIERPRCSDDELVQWLAGARALLFPSLVEGFGMPLVEALAHRVPVIASDLEVFREIAGDIPAYCDPLDGPAWMDQVLAYLPEPSTARRAQLDRMKRFQATTWQRHFESVDRLLDRVMQAQAMTRDDAGPADAPPVARPAPVAVECP
jgi:glycosyltransferase involved in cell wall biosynthesis